MYEVGWFTLGIVISLILMGMGWIRCDRTWQDKYDNYLESTTRLESEWRSQRDSVYDKIDQLTKQIGAPKDTVCLPDLTWYQDVKKLRERLTAANGMIRRRDILIEDITNVIKEFKVP